MSAAELGPQTAYEVLAVRPDVDAEQLRRAYRRAARRAHPDACLLYTSPSPRD